MSLLQKSFGLKNDVRFVFEHITIEQMALTISILIEKNKSLAYTIRL
jgi:hypothetical protein